MLFVLSEIVPTKNNRNITINVKLQCICAMKEYLNKSMDELRMEDYQSNRKFLFVSSTPVSTNFSSTLGKSSSSNLELSFVKTISEYNFFLIYLVPSSTPSTTSNIFVFGSNNTTTTTTPNPFGPTTSTIFSPPGGLFNQPFPTAPAASTNPFTIGTNTPATTSIFNPITTINSFDGKSSITPSPFSKYLIKVI
jgi:nuclear pore complex protein Nup98-Nup96